MLVFVVLGLLCYVLAYVDVPTCSFPPRKDDFSPLLLVWRQTHPALLYGFGGCSGQEACQGTSRYMPRP